MFHHISLTRFILKYGVSCPIDCHPKRDCQCFLKKSTKDCLDEVSPTCLDQLGHGLYM